MKLKNHLATCARFLLPLGLSATAMADVIYVDASGNGQYTNIQSAVNAAVDGDVLLVRTGIYGGFTLDNRALWVVADTGALPKFTAGVVVRNTSSNKTVLLSGLEIALPGNSNPVTALTLENNASHVRVQGCTLHGTSGGPSPVAGGTGASILNSTKVAFVGCTLLGGNGGGVPQWVPLGGRGGDGLVAQGSIAALYDCFLKGGVGGAADYIAPYEQAGDGGDGGHVLDFGILASGCQFQGGMGGGYASIAGNGGTGLRVDNGQAQFIGSTFAGGMGGMSYSGLVGASGQPQSGSGVFNPTAGAARKMSAPRLAAENSTMQVQLSGEPGDRCWLMQTRLPDFVYLPPAAGIRLVLAVAFMTQFPNATLPASGTATVPVFIPALGSGTQAARQYWQSVTISASGQVRLGSAAHVAVLNCSDLLPDCNGNGSCDSCDLLAASAVDCDKNGVPDSCQADCNGNGIADACDISGGLSGDANQNGIPDECEQHTTWHVNSAAAPGGNGTQIAPYQDLAHAFAVASSGDTVLLAPGGYQGSGNRNLNFANRALIVRSTGNAVNTVIDCEGQDRAFNLLQAVPPGARIERLRILNGVAPQWGGGALQINTCSPLIRDCVFENCQGSLGSAISLMYSDARIERCTFIGNSSPSYGAINSSLGAPRYLDCVFAGNQANAGGAAIAVNASTVRIERCQFLGNSTPGNGGVLYGYGDISFDQCLLAGNSSSYGGGLFLVGGPLSMTNCTIVDNAALHGGAAYLSGASTSRVLRNNVIWNNASSAGQPFEIGQGSLDVAWNDLEGGQSSILVTGTGTLAWGPGNLAQYPVFVDPDGPDNSRITFGDNDYRLFVSSTCIDAGDNASVAQDWFDLDGDRNTSEPVPRDLDGNARFVDVPSAPNTGNGTSPIVDLGAFERP